MSLDSRKPTKGVAGGCWGGSEEVLSEGFCRRGRLEEEDDAETEPLASKEEALRLGVPTLPALAAEGWVEEAGG